MGYVVNITVRAERDLAQLYEDINATDSAAARKWYRGLTRKILSLGRKPNRCPVTGENPQLRHLLFGRKPHVYRVIYRVIGHRLGFGPKLRILPVRPRYHFRAAAESVALMSS